MFGNPGVLLRRLLALAALLLAGAAAAALPPPWSEAGLLLSDAAQPPGAYATERVMPAPQVVPLPDDVSFETAAAAMLQGMTVEYLFHRTTPLNPGADCRKSPPASDKSAPNNTWKR